MIERLILAGARTFVKTYKDDEGDLSLTDDPKKNTKIWSKPVYTLDESGTRWLSFDHMNSWLTIFIHSDLFSPFINIYIYLLPCSSWDPPISSVDLSEVTVNSVPAFSLCIFDRAQSVVILRRLSVHSLYSRVLFWTSAVWLDLTLWRSGQRGRFKRFHRVLCVRQWSSQERGRNRRGHAERRGKMASVSAVRIIEERDPGLWEKDNEKGERDGWEKNVSGWKWEKLEREQICSSMPAQRTVMKRLYEGAKKK